MAKDLNLDCYATLGVHRNAEDVVIRAAFKALAQKYHPDRIAGSKDDAHRRMADLTTAYEVLADPAQRKKYDRRLRLLERTASYSGKDSSPETRPPFALVNHASVPATQRRYSVVLIALVAGVVVLSALNVYQYSGRLRDWLGLSPASPPIAARAHRPGAPDGSVPAIGGAMPAEPVPDASVAKASRSRSESGGAAPAIGPGPAVTQVLPFNETDAIPAPDTQQPKAAATLPARPPASDATSATVLQVAVPPPAAAPRKGTRAASTDSTVATKASANRPGATPPATVATEPCGDVVTALGLCKRESTVKEK